MKYKEKSKVIQFERDDDRPAGIFYFAYIDGSEQFFSSSEIRKEIFDKYKDQDHIDCEYDIVLCSMSKTLILVNIPKSQKGYRLMFRKVYRK